MGSVALPESVEEKLRKLKELREDQDTVVKKINKFHSRLSETTREKAEKYSDKLWQKLREYYVNAKKLAEQEERLCAQCMVEIESLGLPPHVTGIPHSSAPPNSTSLKKKPQGDARRPKPKGQAVAGSAPESRQPPRAADRSLAPGGGHVQGQVSVSEPGETVAARISPSDAEKDDWILVKVLSYSAESETYQVFDEEPGEDDDPVGQKKYTLSASCIIPLPTRDTAPDFPSGSHVLAVYPSTTSLYRATVVVGAEPRKNKEDDYFLEFDDDEDPADETQGLPKRRVPFQHVVTLPRGHRQ